MFEFQPHGLPAVDVWISTSRSTCSRCLNFNLTIYLQLMFEFQHHGVPVDDVWISTSRFTCSRCLDFSPTVYLRRSSPWLIVQNQCFIIGACIENKLRLNRLLYSSESDFRGPDHGGKTSFAPSGQWQHNHTMAGPAASVSEAYIYILYNSEYIIIQSHRPLKHNRRQSRLVNIGATNWSCNIEMNLAAQVTAMVIRA